MNKPVLFLALLTCTLLAASCNDAGKSTSDAVKETPPPFDMAVAQKEIDSANRNFMTMISKGDSVGLANAYTFDAKLMTANSPSVVGRKSIQTWVSNILNAGVGKLGLTTTGLWGTEELLAEEGIDSVMGKDGKILDKGKYIVLWKKEDGKWKLFRDCFSSDLPLPSSK